MASPSLRILLCLCGLSACAAPSRPAPQGPASVASGTSVEQRILRVKDYLRRYGYLGSAQTHPYVVASGAPQTQTSRPAASTSSGFDDATRDALRSCQRFLGVEPTGELSDHMLTLMSTSRCGVPDVFDFTIDGRRWNKRNLTYALVEDSRQAARAEILQLLRNAFSQWAAAANLQFAESDDPDTADIIVRFSIREHGDGVPFDGPGGTLAHAFFPPPNGGALAGDAHFDDEETWSTATPAPAGQTDLATVILHEIGHSLGLGHSSVQEAVMFPFYAGQRRQLHPDDIQGVQALYLTE